MKTLIALVLLVALSVNTDAAAIKPLRSSRTNLVDGMYHPGDSLLYKDFVSQPAVPDEVQSVDVTYEGEENTVITSVHALAMGGSVFATPEIVEGGIGENHVTVRITSAEGFGFYYVVDVYGR